MGAIAAAIALHGAALVLGPGVSGGRVSASAAPTSVMAVRIVSAPTSAPTSVQAALATPTVDAPARETSASTQPRRVGDASASTDRQNGTSELRASSRPQPHADPAAAASTALAAAPDYAFGIQLDPGPRPLEDIDPDYPDSVKLRSGTVVLRLLISDTGHVDEVGVVRADPPGVFDQAAIDAFSKARFAPGMVGGRPVKSQMRIEVEFMPINRGARTSGRSY